MKNSKNKEKGTSADMAIQQYHSHIIRKDQLWRQALRTMSFVQNDISLYTKELKVKIDEIEKSRISIEKLKSENIQLKKKNEIESNLRKNETVQFKNKIVALTSNLQKEENLKMVSEQKYLKLIAKVKEDEIYLKELKDEHQSDMNRLNQEIKLTKIKNEKDQSQDKNLKKNLVQSTKDLKKIQLEFKKHREKTEEMKNKYILKISKLEKKIELENNEKEKTNRHFWNLTQENKNLKEKVRILIFLIIFILINYNLNFFFFFLKIHEL